jgi:hypothetical protein
MLPDTDRRALKILFDAHWSPRGWRAEGDRSVAPPDLAYAKRAGYMFDDVRLSHQDVTKRVAKSLQGIDRKAVADAFVASLSSGRLDIRSALGSFAVLQHFPKHTVSKRREECPVCGVYMGGAEVKDLNVLNFERFKWGGVRHDQPTYASFDLLLFQKLPRMSPTPSDVESLKETLQVIEQASAKTTSAALEKRIGKCFKSSKAERDIVVAIFGLCGILETKDHPGFMRRFVRWSDRETPDRHWVDMAYPACWWRRSDGVNQAAVDYWFGHLLQKSPRRTRRCT